MEQRTLKPVGILADFDEESLAALTACGEFQLCSPQKPVINEGEDQDSLYILVQGMLKAVHSSQHGATPLGVIKEGECFGEINIFDPAKASATVIPPKTALVWKITREQLEAYLNSHPAEGCILILLAASVLAKRTRGLVQKVNAVWEMSW